MVNLQEKIGKLCPSAAFEEGDVLMVTINGAEWRALATELRNNPDFAFDVLTAVVGMDWKDSFGCVY